MNPSTKDTGIIIDKATRFGERFGFPALISAILVCYLMYGLYFVLRYEVFYTRDAVEAMGTNIQKMQSKHDMLLMKDAAKMDELVKGGMTPQQAAKQLNSNP